MKYIDVINGIQALRRQAELKQCPVLGAAGIRAFCYPHQLYVVREVLSHTKIRHLLADEVGLGKTIEALMIMNALRIRNGGKLRVSIVVGSSSENSSNKLIEQWRNEIYARLDFSFWKCDMLTNKKKLRWDAKYHPILFKNESTFHNNDEIHFISPQDIDEKESLPDPKNCDLLILDEIHSYTKKLLDILAKYADDYQSVLVLSATPLQEKKQEILQRLHILIPETQDLSTIPIIRSLRRDFGKSMAKREYKILRYEPLENDEERYRRSRQLLLKMIADENITKDNAILFARRASIGGASLAQRVNNFLQRYTQYKDDLQAIGELCKPENGYARFDELMDYLIHFFFEQNNKKIVIVAQDNPTVDYLETAIKRNLPTVRLNQPIEILTLRSEKDKDEESDENTFIDSAGVLEQFMNGNAHILIAHNDARQGFNLQKASALIFFSLPWNPVDLIQWLGRVSRIGSKEKIVDIVILVAIGMVDENIVNIYEQYKIFTNPLNTEAEQYTLQKIIQQIQQKAFNEKTEYNCISNDTTSTNIQIVPQKEAKHLANTFVNHVSQPVINKARNQEEALSNWLALFRKQKIFWIKNISDKHEINHCGKNYIDRKDDTPQQIPYLLKRKQIKVPPEISAPIQQGNITYDLPLHFFNFGSQLHDNFVEHFAKIFSQPKLYKFYISFQDIPSDYLIGICTTQRKQFPHPNLLVGLPKSENKTQEEMRQTEQRHLETGLSADDRFLDLLFPGSLEICGFKKTGTIWSQLKKEILYKFLTQVPTKEQTQRPENIPEKFVNHFTQLANEATQRRWSQNLTNKYEHRIKILQDELNIRSNILQYKISDLQRKIANETNQDIIIRNYEPIQKRLEEQLTLIQKHFDIRKEYLTNCIESKNQVECCCKAVLNLSLQ